MTPNAYKVTLDYRDRQILLLIKGHYEGYKNVSLETMYAQWHDIRLENVNELRIMFMLIESYDRLQEKGVIKETSSALIDNLFRKSLLDGRGDVIMPRDFVAHIKGLYINLPTKSLGVELGEIDWELPMMIDEILEGAG